MIITCCTLQVTAQEEKVEKEEGVKGQHRITLGLGHTHLAKAKDVEGKKVWLPVPSWSFNYTYWLSNQWGIGLQTDLVTEKFVVENADGEEIERDKPFAMVPVALWKFSKHFSLFGGAGVEFAKEENLGLTRLGIEFGVELPKKWEAGIATCWDNKWGNYNSWLLEFSFSKIF